MPATIAEWMSVERGGGDARGERRGVELVIGVQRQRDVHRADLGRARALAEQHVEEVGGVTHHRIRRDRSAARLHPAPGGDDAGDLAGEADRLAIRRLQRVVVRIRIVVAERGGQRAQRIHAVRRRQHLHQPQNRFGQRARRGELRLQVAKLGATRQPAVPQQVAGLLERGVARQVVDVVTAIREHAAIAVEETNPRRGRDDVFETALGFFGCGHISRIMAESAADSRQLRVEICSWQFRCRSTVTDFNPGAGSVLRSLMRRSLTAVCSVLSALSVALVSGSQPSAAWPQFRGPDGAGVLGDGRLPTTWSTRDNIAWGVEVKGRGWSSPVAWGNTVFVTSAISPGAFKAPSTGIFGNDYAAELVKQGLPEDGGQPARHRARHRARRRERRHSLHGLRDRRRHRQGQVGARGAQGRAVRRTPPQEHLRIRDPDHRRRAALRVFRQRRAVRVFARRQAAVDDEVRAAADVPRFRHRGVTGGQQRPRLRGARQRRPVVRGGGGCEDG